MKRSSYLPKMALFFAVFFWGSSFVAMKYAVMSIDPWKIIFFRMLISSFIFLFLFKLWGTFQYKKGDWLLLVIMAVCEPGLYFLLESQAIHYTTAGSAATINALQPPIVAFLAYLFLKEKIGINTIIGIVFCISGAIGLTLAIKSSEYAPIPWLGNILELNAMIASGVYIILLKQLSSRYSPFFLTSLQSFAGVVIFFPFIFHGKSILDINITFSVSAAIIYLATVVTFGGYFLYNWGVSKTSAIEASIFINLIPIFGIIIAFFFLGEKPSLNQLFYICLILVGIFICEMNKKFFKILLKK